jgi:gamma-D-glutamyl-L-lysine dipeptidyl-peptidase
MRDEIQRILDDLRAQNDSRLSVFDLQILGEKDGTVSLTGSLINQGQLASLREVLSHQFPDLPVDTASVRILDRPALPCFHVSTNFTGLHEKPTFRVPLLSELPFGTELEALQEEERWVFARQQDGYLGWAYKPYLAEGGAPEATHLVIAPSDELRAGPDMASEVLTRLMSGTAVLAEETRGAWVRVIANKSGWIPSQHLRALEDLPKAVEEKRRVLLEDSQRMTGVPYLWGGLSGNGIDCSGFAYLLHRWIGIDIPRDADMQCEAARPVEPPFEPGDLFFFAEDDDRQNISHVGISLGGWRMIHSSRSRNGVYVDDLNERRSLMDIYVRAGSFLRES